MIYLPRKVRDWYQSQADTANENMGSYLLKVLIENAFSKGLECEHPSSVRVLHRKGKTHEINGKAIRDRDTYRCTLCGRITV